MAKTGDKKESNSEIRHATMADIAAEVGVSRQLVGLVFRGEPGVGAATEAKIRAAAKKLGYQPNLAARSLRSVNSNYIGVMFRPNESSMGELIPALYKYAHAAGYRLFLSSVSSNHEEENAIQELLGHRCEGLVLFSSQQSKTAIQKLARSIPLVSVGRRLEGVRCGMVSSHGEVGVAEAVEYLIGLGHKQIGYVYAKDMLDSEFRLEGYLSAMKRHKLPTQIVEIEGDFAEEGGSKAADKFITRGLPTAIVCNNDQAALGLSYRLIQSGIEIPKDVSVVGYDDTVASLPFLNLTTVRQDPDEISKAAIDDIVARIKGQQYLSQEILTSSKLVVRTSTGKPKVSTSK
jgi:DNA-binding LacI/PurR family transcriptional regulator